MIADDRPEPNRLSGMRSDVRKLEDTVAIRSFAIEDLLNGQQEAVIVHNGEKYRLRLTSNGKLLLTK
ncbi:MAG: hemin uptake protein HemP [Pseudomonadota bacterium]